MTTEEAMCDYLNSREMRATWCAFRRGLKHRNVFDRDPEELMSIEIHELRRMTLHPASPGSEGRP